MQSMMTMDEMKHYTTIKLQITYKGSKLCLIKEHGRKIIHHNILVLVMNYEFAAISRP